MARAACLSVQFNVLPSALPCVESVEDLVLHSGTQMHLKRFYFDFLLLLFSRNKHKEVSVHYWLRLPPSGCLREGFLQNKHYIKYCFVQYWHTLT